jgi:hypothetical protein
VFVLIVLRAYERYSSLVVEHEVFFVDEHEPK